MSISHFFQATTTNSVLTPILCSVFDIALVFQNKAFHLPSLLCHVLIIYTCTDLQSLTLHIFQNVLTCVTLNSVLHDGC